MGVVLVLQCRLHIVLAIGAICVHVSVQAAAEMLAWSHQALVTGLTRHRFVLLTLRQLRGMKSTHLV